MEANFRFLFPPPRVYRDARSMSEENKFSKKVYWSHFWSLAIELFFSPFLSSHYSFISRTKTNEIDQRWGGRPIDWLSWNVICEFNDFFFSLFFCHCPRSIMLLAAVKMSIGVPHTIGASVDTEKWVENLKNYICEKKVFQFFFYLDRLINFVRWEMGEWARNFGNQHLTDTCIKYLRQKVEFMWDRLEGNLKYASSISYNWRDYLHFSATQSSRLFQNVKTHKTWAMNIHRSR